LPSERISREQASADPGLPTRLALAPAVVEEGDCLQQALRSQIPGHDQRATPCAQPIAS